MTPSAVPLFPPADRCTLGNNRSKRKFPNKKSKFKQPSIQPEAVGFAVPKEEYEKFLAFSRIKDQISGLADDLEEAWNDHCVYLVQEMQIDIPVIGPGANVDDVINKIQEMLRTFKYVAQPKKKKKKNKWFVPLSAGITTTIINDPKSKIPKVSSAKEKDKNKILKPQKSQVILEHIETTDSKIPLSFKAVINISQDEEEAKSLQQIIDEIERGEYQEMEQDRGICHHGNTRPCGICEGEYRYCE